MSDGLESGTAIPTEATEGALAKINVDFLRVRDRITVCTVNNTHWLVVGKNLRCILRSRSLPGQSSHVILRGGTNADATEYTPNRIFVGGRLAYAFEEESTSLITTGVIESMVHEPGLR